MKSATWCTHCPHGAARNTSFAARTPWSFGVGTGRPWFTWSRFAPHDPGQAAVVGTLFLDGQTAALVRFRFGFTRTAYLQPTLERITVDLESALHEQRYWVPFRQRVEVRRRTAWLDFPLQTTIRGVWEVDDYDFDPAFSEALFVGDRYGGLREPDATGPTDALNDRVGEIARTEQREAGDLRRELEALVGSRFVRPDPPRRLAFGGLSDLLHANRVRGLVLGLGWSFRPSSGPVEVRPWAQYGFADQRLVGGVRLVLGSPLRGLEFSASRRVRDLSDWPVVSPLLNSVLAQERAQDFGDYYLADRTETMVHGVLAGGWSAEAGLALERTMSLPTKAQSAAGSHRPNPPLGAGTIGSVRMVLERRAENTRPGRGSVRLTAEGGLGDHDYVRLVAEGRTGFEVGAGTLRLTARAGALLGEVPSNRVFVLGGRGTLTGEGFRAFGGRRMALARLEWRIPLFLASFGGRGLQDRAFAAPFLAAGWTDGVPGPGNRAKTQGIRPVLGVATDLLFQTMRIELGWAPRAGRVGLVFDASPGWWPIL